MRHYQIIKPASGKTHAGLGGNAILKFTTGKLGLYHNFTDRITPTGFAYVAFGSIRVSQLLTLAPPRSSVVFDPKLGDWDAKLRHEDVELDGKTIHVFFC